MLVEPFSRYSFYTVEARTSFRVITESHLLPAITSAADYVTIITTIDYHFIEVADGWNRYKLDNSAFAHVRRKLFRLLYVHIWWIEFNDIELRKFDDKSVDHWSKGY